MMHYSNMCQRERARLRFDNEELRREKQLLLAEYLEMMEVIAHATACTRTYRNTMRPDSPLIDDTDILLRKLQRLSARLEKRLEKAGAVR